MNDYVISSSCIHSRIQNLSINHSLHRSFFSTTLPKQINLFLVLSKSSFTLKVSGILSVLLFLTSQLFFTNKFLTQSMSTVSLLSTPVTALQPTSSQIYHEHSQSSLRENIKPNSSIPFSIQPLIKQKHIHSLVSLYIYMFGKNVFPSVLYTVTHGILQ